MSSPATTRRLDPSHPSHRGSVFGTLVKISSFFVVTLLFARRGSRQGITHGISIWMAVLLKEILIQSASSASLQLTLRVEPTQSVLRSRSCSKHSWPLPLPLHSFNLHGMSLGVVQHL
ncbi:hypothetical protein FIBSPDRAFT_200010 [Athelia psychrophila]|uniref:Uncharacterized protein n=1 Tax=Athelia psychrophila TaxID=1759441 RepID=A0A165ZNL2_9AGAM|nr:hypothetical protein FIBSPDRAFT_200010 [Fibularhizoctonia sp. CBS 109695]